MSVGSTLAAIRRIERRLRVSNGERRAYSHQQLVRMAAYQAAHGRPQDWTPIVGSPEDQLGPGEESHAELVALAAQQLAMFGSASVPPVSE